MSPHPADISLCTVKTVLKATVISAVYCIIPSAVALDARDAKTRQTVAIDSALPGHEFFNREAITLASVFQTQDSTTNSGNNLSFPTRDPPLGSWRWKRIQRYRRTIRADYVLSGALMRHLHYLRRYFPRLTQSL
jgi:hypothetical protein